MWESAYLSSLSSIHFIPCAVDPLWIGIIENSVASSIGLPPTTPIFDRNPCFPKKETSTSPISFTYSLPLVESINKGCTSFCEEGNKGCPRDGSSYGHVSSDGEHL